MSRRRVSPEIDEDLEIEVEALTMRAADLIEEAMHDAGISRAELARRMGVSRVHVTQFLNGQRNLTLRTIAEALYAVGMRMDPQVKPLRNQHRCARGSNVEREVLWAAMRNFLERTGPTAWQERPDRPSVDWLWSTHECDVVLEAKRPIAHGAKDRPSGVGPQERRWLHSAPAREGVSMVSALAETGHIAGV